MPPRLSLPLRLRASNVSLSSSPSQRSFTTTSILSAGIASHKRNHRDSYSIAQARQRKAANLARQEELRHERAASLGDPVRGITTPFLQSLNQIKPKPFAPLFKPSKATAAAESTSTPDSPDAKQTTPPTTTTAAAPTLHQPEKHLNHFLTQQSLMSALEYSTTLTTPPPSNRTTSDPDRDSARLAAHKAHAANARTAISRIVALSNGSGAAHRRTNIQRCVSYFGRHHTDAVLEPKPASSVPGAHPTKTPRAGPDTGSPEVQVAVLTVKIRALAKHLAGVGRKDMVNKRNLRVLVHKRQKLLQYLRRKERGGERWQHLITELGLTEGTWKGEISL